MTCGTFCWQQRKKPGRLVVYKSIRLHTDYMGTRSVTVNIEYQLGAYFFKFWLVKDVSEIMCKAGNASDNGPKILLVHPRQSVVARAQDVGNCKRPATPLLNLWRYGALVCTSFPTFSTSWSTHTHIDSLSLSLSARNVGWRSSVWSSLTCGVEANHWYAEMYVSSVCVSGYGECYSWCVISTPRGWFSCRALTEHSLWVKTVRYASPSLTIISPSFEIGCLRWPGNSPNSCPNV